MMKYIAILISSLLLGCETSPSVQRCIDTTPRMTAARFDCISNANENDRNQAIVQSLQSRCDAFGFERGTDAYRQCLIQIRQQDITNDAIAAEQQRRAFKDAERAISPNRGVVNCYKAPGSPVTTCQ